MPHDIGSMMDEDSHEQMQEDGEKETDNSKNYLKEHKKDSLELKCPSCEICSSSIDSFIHHQKIHLKNKFQYFCNLCSYSTKVMDHLRKHLMRHYDIKPFKCEICHYSCVTKHQLTVHSLNHLNLKRSRYVR